MLTVTMIGLMLARSPCVCVRPVAATSIAAAPQAPAPAATATNPKQDTQAIIAGLTKEAQQFQRTAASVAKILKQSAHSQASGEKAIDMMLQALNGVESTIGNDSPLWQQFSRTVATWQKNEQDAQSEATNDPSFQPIAAAWAKRVDQAASLRSSIIHERDRVAGEIATVKHKKKIVLSWYELDQANKAIAGMEQLNDQIKGIDTDLTKMVVKAHQMGPGV